LKVPIAEVFELSTDAKVFSSSIASATRVGVWEGKDPGSVRVLLANPRWGRRFLKFLEPSGVGRMMANGTGEDEAWAAAMDEWIVWEAEDRNWFPLLFPWCSLISLRDDKNETKINK